MSTQRNTPSTQDTSSTTMPQNPRFQARMDNEPEDTFIKRALLYHFQYDLNIDTTGLNIITQPSSGGGFAAIHTVTFSREIMLNGYNITSADIVILKKAREPNDRQPNLEIVMEAGALKDLSDPAKHSSQFVPHYYDSFEGIMILMEQIGRGKTLLGRLGAQSISLESFKDGARKVVEGIEATVQAGYVHFDPSINNFIFDDNDNFKILDWGLFTKDYWTGRSMGYQPGTIPGTTPFHAFAYTVPGNEKTIGDVIGMRLFRDYQNAIPAENTTGLNSREDFANHFKMSKRYLYLFTQFLIFNYAFYSLAGRNAANSPVTLPLFDQNGHLIDGRIDEIIASSKYTTFDDDRKERLRNWIDVIGTSFADLSPDSDMVLGPRIEELLDIITPVSTY